MLYRGGYNCSILIGGTVNNATRSKHVFCNQALNYKLCRKEVKLVFCIAVEVLLGLEHVFPLLYSLSASADEK